MGNDWRTKLTERAAGGVPGFLGQNTDPTGVSIPEHTYRASDFGAASGTDSRAALQAAIDTAASNGGGRIAISQMYPLSGPFEPKSNVELYASAPGAGFRSLVTGSCIQSGTAPFSNFTLTDLTFLGPVNQTVSVPTRARTTSGPGTDIAIWISGDLDTSSSFPRIENLVIRGCTFRNCTSLPIRIFGVRGQVLTTECSFVNCMDAGWGFNEEVICTSNRSYMSADNGFSLSRGNTKVTCVGNTVELAAYYGIWLSGWESDVGPTNFTCVGNTIRNVGNSGIKLADAPRYGVVSGNIVDQGYNRGPVDDRTDISADGIFVRGAPSTSPAAPTTYATGLSIVGNTIRRAARAGISVSGAKGVVISDNLILDVGTQFYFNGTTPIGTDLASMGNPQNIGIFFPHTNTAGNVSDIHVRNNTILDLRSTPYCNTAIYPFPPIAGVTAAGNIQRGLRLDTTLPTLVRSDVLGSSAAGEESMPRWSATSMTGITMSTGVLRLGFFRARASRTVSQLRAATGNTAAGATPTLVRYGLYSVDSSGNLTLMSATTSDTAVFASTQTPYARSLAAAQTLVEGQVYAIGVLVVTGATAPTIIGSVAGTPALNGLDPRLCASLSAQSDLPSSITVGSLADSQSVPYVQAL